MNIYKMEQTGAATEENENVFDEMYVLHNERVKDYLIQTSKILLSLNFLLGCNTKDN